MTYSIWNGLCEQPTQPVSTEKYAAIVYDLTAQLHEPIGSILSTLDRRAMALSKLANFTAALRDARVMQQISPSSPLGYVREATIYSEQGKQRDVIDVCNRGMMIVERYGMHYEVLRRAKADAERREVTRIDFIRQLPIDIVTTTLIPMFVDDDSRLDTLKPCSYLHVSNLWRHYILQCLDGLRFETTYEEREQVIEERWQLIKFARHIKELHVRRYSEGTWLSDLLCNNDFSSLKELCLFTGLVPGYSDDFTLMLGSIGRTLTHLAIYGEYADNAPLDVILSNCPHLVSFTIHQPSCDDFSSLPMTTWPTMKTLSVNYTEDDEFTRNQIMSICQRFPSLTNLDIHPFPDIESALMIPQHCPLLKRAEIVIHDWHITGFFSDESTGHEDLVVTRLSIYEDDWFGNEDFVDTAPLLNWYHATIEVIEWDITPDRDFQHLHNIEYPRLRKLTLETSGSWILQHAPILEELVMSSTVINAHPEALHTIPSTLKKLEFKLDDLENEAAMGTYLQRVSQQCELHELVIRINSSKASRDVLDAIPRINTLQRLMISVCGKWKSYRMERFFECLKNVCRNLSCLEIDAMIAPSVTSVNALKSLERLKRFTFPIHHMRDSDSFWHAIRTFPQLSCIRIYPESAINHADIRVLKDHRRSMNIIVDDQFTPF